MYISVIGFLGQNFHFLRMYYQLGGQETALFVEKHPYWSRVEMKNFIRLHCISFYATTTKNVKVSHGFFRYNFQFFITVAYYSAYNYTVSSSVLYTIQPNVKKYSFYIYASKVRSLHYRKESLILTTKTRKENGSLSSRV